MKTGARANGANLPGFEETRQEVQKAIDAAPWITASDLPLVEVFTSELNAYRHASDVLARMSDPAYTRKLNAAKLVTRKARVLGDLADKLGMTPLARVKLGLQAAQTEQVRVQPVRTPERARAMAQILARSHAFPRPESVVEAEVVHEPEPEGASSNE